MTIIGSDRILVMKTLSYYRLPLEKRQQLVRCFLEDLTALQTARIAGINRKTVNSWFNFFRRELSRHPVATQSFKNSLVEGKFARFWAQRQARLYGIPNKTRPLHRAECLLRFFAKKDEIGGFLHNAMLARRE